MFAPSHGSMLQPLLQRLEAVQRVVDAVFVEKEDRELIRSLEDGTYGSRELDQLFELIEKPFHAAVTVLAAGNRRTPVRLTSYHPGDDPFYRAVDLLSRGETSSDGPGIPAIDLLASDEEDQRLGRKGAAQVGLVRRLIRLYGLDRIEIMIQRVIDDMDPPQPHLLRSGQIHYKLPKARTSEDVARLLRLVAPIERDHMFPILMFVSPTLQQVDSTFSGGQQCSPRYYMGVDK